MHGYCNVWQQLYFSFFSFPFLSTSFTEVESTKFLIALHLQAELAEPPVSAHIGERVTFSGCESECIPDEILNPKKKVWETSKVDLQTSEELVACYKNFCSPRLQSFASYRPCPYAVDQQGRQASSFGSKVEQIED